MTQEGRLLQIETSAFQGQRRNRGPFLQFLQLNRYNHRTHLRMRYIGQESLESRDRLLGSPVASYEYNGSRLEGLVNAQVMDQR